MQKPVTPLSAMLLRAERTPEATAFIAGKDKWTYRRLAEQTELLASSLSLRGIKAGDRIALHMFNIPELIVAYCACFRTAAIAVPLNTRYKSAEIKTVVERTRPALYLGQPELYENAKDMDPTVLPLENRYLTHLDSGEDGVNEWTKLVSPQNLQLKGAPIDEDMDTPAVLLATSGTTGPSKLVVWTARMLASFSASALGRGVSTQDTVLVNTPMMHGSGVYYMCSSLLHAAVMVLLPQFEPTAVLEAIEEHHCTTFFGLPFMCTNIIRSQKTMPRNLQSLRLCTVAGDVCPAETEREFEETVGRPLLSFWASAEDVGSMVVGSKVGPFMHPLPQIQLKIVNESGENVQVGDTGEMLVRSSTTTPGYWMGPDDIESLPEGWFHSGDLVRTESDGDLRYMGRKKDLIIRGGSNISPIEVESALLLNPSVVDAAVVGLPDMELGQRVGAAVVLAEGIHSSVLPDILASVRQIMADYKVPERVEVVKAIPRNTLTKIDRAAVASMIVRPHD